jgi:hypothetical protein
MNSMFGNGVSDSLRLRDGGRGGASWEACGNGSEVVMNGYGFKLHA